MPIPTNKYLKVLRSTWKYFKVPTSTSTTPAYLKVQQSTYYYHKVPRSTSKYLRVPISRGWAKPETKNWYRFKNFLIYVRLPLFDYCSIGPSLLSLSAMTRVFHDQWELLSLSKYPALSEIYLEEIRRHYRLGRIFFLLPNFLFLVIEIKKQDIKIDGQYSDNSACFLK